jgi:aquaporin PIP
MAALQPNDCVVTMDNVNEKQKANQTETSVQIKHSIDLSQPETQREIGVIVSEPITAEFLRACLAEFLATLLFLYITVSTILFRNGGDSNGNSYPVTDAAWAFGASILILVYSFAGISGANINPAVSFGLMIVKSISLTRCVAYTLSQCLGAYVGSAIAKIIGPDSSASPWNAVSEGTEANQALLAEIMGTFCLVWVVMSSVDDHRQTKIPHLGPLAPLAIGMTVFVLHLGMIGVDNCSINPARSFGASLAFGEWDDHWVFWIGPILGGILAGMCYELLFKEVQRS